MDFLKSVIKAGISVRNESAVPILVVASQLTPLYWGKVMPGDTWNEGNQVGMGKVWFTMSASVYDQKDVPTAGEVALRIAGITAAAVVHPWLFIGSAVASGVTSVKGASKTGVYSDGRLLVIRGAAAPDGTYHLYFHEEGQGAYVPQTVPMQATQATTVAGAHVAQGSADQPGAVTGVPVQGQSGPMPGLGAVSPSAAVTASVPADVHVPTAEPWTGGAPPGMSIGVGQPVHGGYHALPSQEPPPDVNAGVLAGRNAAVI